MNKEQLKGGGGGERGALKKYFNVNICHQVTDLAKMLREGVRVGIRVFLPPSLSLSHKMP